MLKIAITLAISFFTLTSRAEGRPLIVLLIENLKNNSLIEQTEIYQINENLKEFPKEKILQIYETEFKRSFLNHFINFKTNKDYISNTTPDFLYQKFASTNPYNQEIIRQINFDLIEYPKSSKSRIMRPHLNSILFQLHKTSPAKANALFLKIGIESFKNFKIRIKQYLTYNQTFQNDYEPLNLMSFFEVPSSSKDIIKELEIIESKKSSLPQPSNDWIPSENPIDYASGDPRTSNDASELPVPTNDWVLD